MAFPALVTVSAGVDGKLTVTCSLTQQLDFFVDPVIQGLIRAATNFKSYSTVEMQLALKRKKMFDVFEDSISGIQTVHVRLLME